MLNTPWETGSALYRRLVVSALVVTGVGILGAIAGALIGVKALSFIALPVIVIGLLLHVASMIVRTREARRRTMARERP